MDACDLLDVLDLFERSDSLSSLADVSGLSERLRLRAVPRAVFLAWLATIASRRAVRLADLALCLFSLLVSDR